ncbi:sperm tail-domain-containing protein [Phlyctochytrium arcticum]|nr:sperm tail-domain-containing protein [Phlyctochytrium arcticum]
MPAKLGPLDGNTHSVPLAGGSTNGPPASAAHDVDDVVGFTIGGDGDLDEGEGDTSREARIAGRKRRMEARRLARMRPEKPEENTATRRTKKPEPSQAESSKSKSQIFTSKNRIETTKSTSSEQVTHVRVSLIGREDARRQEEARKVQVWGRKRDEEKDKSRMRGEDIQAAWGRALSIGGGPYELHELLTDQKKSCDDLIAIKNKLIEEYATELKSKDDEYVKELKRQAEEIDTVLARMETHHRAFQTTLREELEQIERAFVEERTELIDSNVKDIDGLFESRAANEAKYMEERGGRVEDHVHQLEALRGHDAEEYNLVKIKLETDVQVLEQQLQQMRATYQLNTEKLEYNFQVLKKRDEENGTILGAQKRKVTRLTDHVNTLKAKLNKQEKGFQQEYTGLSDDYKRITEQFKELQKKFRHFQVADGKKFRDVWQMNEEMAKELMRKLFQADQIIHEQQLGITWSADAAQDAFRTIDPAIFHSAPPAAAAAALQAVTGGAGGRSISRGAGDRGSVASTNGGDGHTSTAQQLGHSTEGPKAPASVARSNMSIAARILSQPDLLAPEHQTSTSDPSHGPSHGRPHPLAPTSPATKRMLDLLCTEASFLVEEKLQKLLSPLHSTEQSLMKLDSIFKALGVESMEDLERLMDHFVKSKDGDAPPNSEVELIEPNEVVGAVRKFVEEKKAGRLGGGAPTQVGRSSSAALLEDDEDESHTREMLALKSHKDGRGDDSESDSDGDNQVGDATSRSQNLRQYWHRMSDVIDPRKFRVWTAVHTAMTHYNAALVARYTLSTEVESIRQQNDELKMLLRQYMQAKVNEELHIPPAKIFMAQAGVQAL